MAFFSCRIGSISIVKISEMTQRKLMSSTRVTLQACVVLSLVILSQLTLAEGAGIHKRESEDGVTIPAENQTSTQNTTLEGSSSNKSNTGAVVAASIITVLACVAVVVGVYIFKRRRQSRMMDKEKKMQIQMSSARNAGIYQDLTVSVPVEEKPSASPEHERLKSVEDA